MRKMCVFRVPVSTILLAFFIVPAAAHAASCAAVVGGTTYSSINDALAAIGTGPGTIFVTGTCSENVSINNGRSITIAAPTPGGATIVGPLDTDAFDIFQSQEIVLHNLEIRGTFSTTGNGGGGGVVITDASLVRIVGCNIHDNQGVGVDADTGSILYLRDTIIQNNTPNDGLDVLGNANAFVGGTTIQNNGDSLNGGVGVFVTTSSVVFFNRTNFILNNADIGILISGLANVTLRGDPTVGFTTVQGHNTNGIIVVKQSHLQINAPAVIQGNGAACPLDPTCGGIFATANSTVHLRTGTVSGNQGSGISVQQGANLRLNGATISNNSGDGIHIQWISIGDFLPGNTITANGGKSVFCDTTSLAVGDLSTFPNVGCAQIARSIGPPRPGAVR